ncbi:MAG: DUF3019 domain-containing protein [Methylococcales bacterium]
MEKYLQQCSRRSGRMDVLKKNRILLILAITLSTQIKANDTMFSLKIVPDRCIGLHQGQVCYQLTTLSWQMPITSDYCLFQEKIASPLKCWNATDSGVLKIDFQSAEPVHYHLYEIGKKNAVTSSTVSVSWVYKSLKRQRRSWRLF